MIHFNMSMLMYPYFMNGLATVYYVVRKSRFACSFGSLFNFFTFDLISFFACSHLSTSGCGLKTHSDALINGYILYIAHSSGCLRTISQLFSYRTVCLSVNVFTTQQKRAIVFRNRVKCTSCIETLEQEKRHTHSLFV